MALALTQSTDGMSKCHYDFIRFNFWYKCKVNSLCDV